MLAIQERSTCRGLQKLKSQKIAIKLKSKTLNILILMQEEINLQKPTSTDRRPDSYISLSVST